MWSEYASAETVDSRIWPRMAAIAERFWSPRELTDVESMYNRMEAVSGSLEWVGLRHRSSPAAMLDRLAGGGSARALRILAGPSEALGIEGRRGARAYSSLVPLNRFVDAVPPVSEFVRRLEHDAAKIPEDRAVTAQLRATLGEWADSQAEIQLLAENNGLLTEVAPLARNLSSIARIGLRALDYLEQHRAPPQGWVAGQTQELDRLEAPIAEVRIAAGRPVRLLLAALSRQAAGIRRQALERASVRCGNEPRCNGSTTVVNWTFGSIEHNIALKNNALGGQSGVRANANGRGEK
jgi:hexosaminidase